MDLRLSLVWLAAMAQVAVAADRASSTAAFYVAPDGYDAHPGTLEQPFATLARARDAVRRRIAEGMRDPCTIYLRGGEYRLKEPLLLGAIDTIGPRASVSYAAYEGEVPVISGARRIQGFTKDEDGRWTATLPAVKAGLWYPRQLFVDGQRRQRARTPNNGFFRGMKSTDGKMIVLPPGQLAAWSHPDDVELITDVEWTQSRARLKAIDREQNMLDFSQPVLQFFAGSGMEHVRRNVENFPYYLENAREMLDAPGEWHLDRHTGVLTYWPLPGEYPEQATVVMPWLQELIRVEGTREAGVEGLRFDGLRFEYTDFLPPDPFLPQQAGFGDPLQEEPTAAVTLEHAAHCAVTNCRFIHLGGTGLRIGPGGAENVVERSVFREIGMNGIEIGIRDAHPQDARDVTRSTQIANNHFQRCALDNAGCVGVWVGIARETRVSHNLVQDLPYSGISVGWNWTSDETPCEGNVVEFNHIHHVMQQLTDGGGVYTLGRQPNSQLRGNLVHDVPHSSGVAEANGFFIDEGSSGWRIEGNIIYRTADRPIRHHRNLPDDQSWGANTLGITPDNPRFPKDSARKAGIEPKYRQAVLAN